MAELLCQDLKEVRMEGTIGAEASSLCQADTRVRSIRRHLVVLIPL